LYRKETTNTKLMTVTQMMNGDAPVAVWGSGSFSREREKGPGTT
jgi:hypothetical protein